MSCDVLSRDVLKPYISDSQMPLKDSNSFRADRPKRKGGGCLLYFQNSLLVSEDYSYSDNFHSLLACFISSMNTFVAVIYRPPDATSGSVGKVVTSSIFCKAKLTTCPPTTELPISTWWHMPVESFWYNILLAVWYTNQQVNMQFASDLSCPARAFGQKLPQPDYNHANLTRNNNLIETNVHDTQLSDHNYKLVELLLGSKPIGHLTIVKGW